MNEYVAVQFEITDPIQREVLNYRLGQYEVESIEEREATLVGYFNAKTWARVSTLPIFSALNYTVEKIENKNWNAQWEASFRPVLIDDFCYVRAPFHEPLEKTDIIDIILEPKMAFGTAHHETTFMMMREMKRIDFIGKSVFDYGCGTAILSILAEKLGAKEVYAIDIEENAVENAVFNSEKNKCQRIQCDQKTLEAMESKTFDIILANINRAVLLNSANQLPNFLNRDGILLISGILVDDEDLVVATYKKAGFIHEKTEEKGEWKCLKMRLTN